MKKNLKQILNLKKNLKKSKNKIKKNIPKNPKIPKKYQKSKKSIKTTTKIKKKKVRSMSKYVKKSQTSEFFSKNLKILKLYFLHKKKSFAIPIHVSNLYSMARG